MPHKFAEIAFTETVRQVQEEMGSRSGYAGMDEGPDYNNLMSEVEASFIAGRDSFYMATVGETGWPYVQHRGGPTGFVKVLDNNKIGFADYAGNRQYVTTGNVRTDDRVSLFFMDYPNRRRLKVLGRMQQVPSSDLETLAQLEDDHFRAPVERAFIIYIEAFDWNCPKYITPRFTDKDVETFLSPLQQELEALRSDRGAVGIKMPQETVEQQDKGIIGNGPLPLKITAIRQETDDIRSYELSSIDGSPLPQISAGAHIQVPVKTAGGDIVWRFYSICSNPHQRDYYRIAVLEQKDGRGGSTALHKSYQVGDELACYRPDNYFGLRMDRHADGEKAVLIAGGIGITPILSMQASLERSGYQYHLHYAARSQAHAAFLQKLKSKASHLNLWFSDEDRRIDFEHLFASYEQGTVFYLCGPAQMLKAALNASVRVGITPDNLVFEAFEE